MVKYFESISSFLYSWDQVANAFWRRYPNPYSTHVLTEDTLSREIRGSILYTKRILTKTNRLPKWGEMLVPNTLVCIVEESYVNPDEKTIITLTRNIGYTRVMNIVERVTYTASETPIDSTGVQREAWISSQIYGLRRAIEGFGIERFKKNCTKASLGFEHVIRHLYSLSNNNTNTTTTTNTTTSHNHNQNQSHQQSATTSTINKNNKLEETTEKIKVKAIKIAETTKANCNTSSTSNII